MENLRELPKVGLHNPLRNKKQAQTREARARLLLPPSPQQGPYPSEQQERFRFRAQQQFPKESRRFEVGHPNEQCSEKQERNGGVRGTSEKRRPASSKRDKFIQELQQTNRE